MGSLLRDDNWDGWAFGVLNGRDMVRESLLHIKGRRLEFWNRRRDMIMMLMS